MPLTGRIVDEIGYAAAICTTVAFIPQLVRILRLRSAREISLPTFLLYSIGVLLWLLYGIWDHSGPMIASNSASLLLSASIFILKLRYDRHATQELKP